MAWISLTQCAPLIDRAQSGPTDPQHSGRIPSQEGDFDQDKLPSLKVRNWRTLHFALWLQKGLLKRLSLFAATKQDCPKKALFGQSIALLSEASSWIEILMPVGAPALTIAWSGWRRCPRHFVLESLASSRGDRSDAL